MLAQKPYSKAVDCWSIGVISYILWVTLRSVLIEHRMDTFCSEILHKDNILMICSKIILMHLDGLIVLVILIIFDEKISWISWFSSVVLYQFVWLSSVLRWEWCQTIWTDPEGWIRVWLSLLGWYLWFRYQSLFFSPLLSLQYESIL